MPVPALPLTIFGGRQARMTSIPEALTFDDVLLMPGQSDTLPAAADTTTKISHDIELKIPVISAAMDTVTEAELAIAMAQAGGLGVIHRNMTPAAQAEHVARVKKFESGIVGNPVTIAPDAPLQQALDLMEHHSISGIPVVEPGTHLLAGILTHRDVRFARETTQPVSSYMTRENLITVRENVDLEDAKNLLHRHRIEKLLVVDENYRCIGLLTVKDIEKAKLHPNASKDQHGHLRAAAAIGTGDEEGIARARLLVEAGVDLLVIDTAHGHSRNVSETLRAVKRLSNTTRVAAGNVATSEGVAELVEAGADAVKVGIGPGSICTTRIVAGVGVPQLTAIMDAAKAVKGRDVAIIADGGIKYSGDLAKALAAGASCAMIGNLLAGSDETPGDMFLYQGRSYKSYRGMGSIGAMAGGSSNRYGQDAANADKLVPEGVEGRVPYRGPVAAIIRQLVGGLQASMGYAGAATLKEFHRKARFVRMSPASLRESHVHSVAVTREAPNYPGNAGEG